MAKKTWLFVIYLIVGLYIINMGFGFIPMPEKILFLDKWILLIAGVLVIFSGFRFLKEIPFV